VNSRRARAAPRWHPRRVLDQSPRARPRGATASAGAARDHQVGPERPPDRSRPADCADACHNSGRRARPGEVGAQRSPWRADACRPRAAATLAGQRLAGSRADRARSRPATPPSLPPPLGRGPRRARSPNRRTCQRAAARRTVRPAVRGDNVPRPGPARLPPRFKPRALPAPTPTRTPLRDQPGGRDLRRHRQAASLGVRGHHAGADAVHLATRSRTARMNCSWSCARRIRARRRLPGRGRDRGEARSPPRQHDRLEVRRAARTERKGRGVPPPPGPYSVYVSPLRSARPTRLLEVAMPSTAGSVIAGRAPTTRQPHPVVRGGVVWMSAGR